MEILSHGNGQTLTSGSWGFLLAVHFPLPVGFPVDGTDREAAGMMEHPVQQGPRQHRVPKHFRPLPHRKIAGGDQRAVLVDGAQQCEEPGGLIAIHRDVSDLIDDEDIGLLDALDPVLGKEREYDSHEQGTQE